jgi:hypothetical protein
MAVYFFTSDAQKILDNFDARIKQTQEKGKITTWEKSDDGIYYTHKAKEWNKKAWFKPTVGTDRLTFNIIKPKNQNVTTPVYGYYHGHLIETFLNHFDDDFKRGEATARAVTGDNCTA